ncbi:MAG: glycine oxidase ThiO [Anaerolineae bacterium]|nr:glycine oxidase ThiO [Gloeobacterales cyanobacterium ES-bin-313]
MIGLSIAIELHQGGAEVFVLDRGDSPATWAAAGMLAPQAENLGDSPLGQLGFYSRDLWPDWAKKLEKLSGLNIDYQACGIFLPGNQGRSAEGQWWNAQVLQSQIPGINVQAGVWFPQEGCVDNRLVFQALKRACEHLGIPVHRGVTIFGPGDPQLQTVNTSSGVIAADLFVLAQGSWSGEWLDIPVYPLKGQMLAIQAEIGQLKTVIFSESTYIVPRLDGRIVVGATQEWAGFAPGNSEPEISTLHRSAIDLLPWLAGYPVIETWWGFRPTTPDQSPMIGEGPWPHLCLATGHHRNGILLAPATAYLLSQQILTGKPEALLAPFSWKRFVKDGLCQGEGAKGLQ